MKDNFSLETLKNEIVSNSTSKYFEEVYSSYINKNYRSALVMLWSVIVYDVVHKLQTLEDTYNDTNATKILKDIRELQKKNSTSSAWELKLIKDVCEKTDLIDFTEYKTLEYIQTQRHLSAHPVLKETETTSLYVPNKDTTRALIRSGLEIVFIKPPIYTDKILTKLLMDLSETANIYPDIATLYKYVKAPYLERISTDSKMKIFETFWRFVMQKDDPQCSKNRAANLRFLSILALDNLERVKEKIADRVGFYSNIKNEEEFMLPLIVFLARVPSIYPILDIRTQMLVKTWTERDIESELVGFFYKDSVEEHYEHLKKLFMAQGQNKDINKGAWEALKKVSESKEMEREFTQALSRYYTQSATFEAADKSFRNIINFIDSFNIEAFEHLLEDSEESNQTYRREQAQDDYIKIKEKILEMDEDFEFTRYPHFNRTIAGARKARY